jgi:PilZ domain
MRETSERRRHERLTFSSPLAVRRGDHVQRIDADACDLSVAGMSFRTTLPLMVGDEVRIHVAKTAGNAIAARVRRVAVRDDVYFVGVEHTPVA